MSLSSSTKSCLTWKRSCTSHGPNLSPFYRCISDAWDKRSVFSKFIQLTWDQTRGRYSSQSKCFLGPATASLDLKRPWCGKDQGSYSLLCCLLLPGRLSPSSTTSHNPWIVGFCRYSRVTVGVCGCFVFEQTDKVGRDTVPAKHYERSKNDLDRPICFVFTSSWTRV